MTCEQTQQCVARLYTLTPALTMQLAACIYRASYHQQAVDGTRVTYIRTYTAGRGRLVQVMMGSQSQSGRCSKLACASRDRSETHWVLHHRTAGTCLFDIS